MTPATSEGEKVRFHTLNKDTGNRVVSQYVDSVTGKPVKDENEAKGYARGENDYVILTDDDLDQVQGKSEQLVGRIQERYGYAKADAQREFDDWARDRRP